MKWLMPDRCTYPLLGNLQSGARNNILSAASLMQGADLSTLNSRSLMKQVYSGWVYKSMLSVYTLSLGTLRI